MQILFQKLNMISLRKCSFMTKCTCYIETGILWYLVEYGHQLWTKREDEAIRHS